MESLVRGEHRPIAAPHVCVCVWDMARCADLTDLLPSARRRAAGTWQHWLLRLSWGKCHHIWQELEIRQTLNSTQFHSDIYLSNLLFAIMPNADGHLGPCPKLAMLQSLGGSWGTQVFMFRLQTGVTAGKSRAIQESGQEVPWARRVQCSQLQWLQGALARASSLTRHPALLLCQQTVTGVSWAVGEGCCAPEGSFSLR